MVKIFASTSPDIEEREIRHMAISKEVASECMVLLRNNGALPLKEERKVALYGEGVRHTVKGGTGSGDVNTRNNVNVEQGFINAGFEIANTDWLDRQDAFYNETKSAYKKWLSATAKENNTQEFLVEFDYPFKSKGPIDITKDDVVDADTDVAIYVIARNSGEGADRYANKGDYELFDSEVENLKILGASFKKTIVVLNIGGLIDMSVLDSIEGIDSIVLMTQLGNITGDVIADLISGKVTPSGKTSNTWAKNYMDYPSSAKFSHHDSVHDEMYEDGIYVGYRYFDSFKKEVEYPFGYGLSYTSFEIYDEVVSVVDDKAKINVKVKNTGKEYSGKEVVQVYISAPKGSIDKPYQSLIAYSKTPLLAPGEDCELELSFDVADMASYYEDKAAWILDKGDYIVRVGNSSRDTRVVGILTLEESIATSTVKNVFALDVDLEEIKPSEVIDISPINSDVARCIINPDKIRRDVIRYSGVREEYVTDKTELLSLNDVKQGKCTVEELVSQLTLEEMAELCVGTLRNDSDRVVGNASYIVPGAAGDSSSICKESRGIKNMILADGPAGLRLQPHFKVYKKDQTLVPGGGGFADNIDPFPADLDENEVDNYYQYCTAIPIGWALAQSFNIELIEKAGDMIGFEMEQFNVDLWLAPAMNIHRNPLCGRNFEYYSEDPLVSGKTAAAITIGVQKHAGKGTTIKHFAANNQEDNRYFVNAHVSERALREIYLKGFEIAVKESQPLSIMTSYNLINGIHTANSYDLIQSVARDEWNFKGVIMTDWFTSQNVPAITGKFGANYPISASTGCIYAGNDMQMPGCQKNVDDIIEAITEDKEIDGFKITKADLQFNTANVIRCVLLTSVEE